MTQYGPPSPQQPQYPPPQIGYQSPGAWGRPGPSGLGIASLVLALIALVAAFVPCCGMVVAIPVGIVAGVLGLVGFIAAGSGGQPRGMPLAGLILSLVALAITFAWPFIIAAIPSPTPAFPGGTTQPTTFPTTGPSTGDPGDAEAPDEPADPPPAGGRSSERDR